MTVTPMQVARASNASRQKAGSKQSKQEAAKTTTSIPSTTSRTTSQRSRTRREDCTQTKCCNDPGMQCYEKYQYWASCQVNCTPGFDLRDRGEHRTWWTCRHL